MGQLAICYAAGRSFIGTEEKPCFIDKIAEMQGPRGVGAVQRNGQLRVPLDGTGTLGPGLTAKIRCRGVEPFQIVLQTAFVHFPAFRCTAVFIQQVIRVHKMRADIVHIQLTHSR